MHQRININTAQHFRLIAAMAVLFMVIHSTLICQQLEQSAAYPQGLIANVGQWPSHILYLSRQSGTDVWITRRGVEINRYSISESRLQMTGSIERHTYENADPLARVVAFDELCRVNFIRGNVAQKHFSAPVYTAATVRDFLPGVDLCFRTSDDGLEQELMPRPGVSIGSIRVHIEGQASVRSTAAPRKKMLYSAHIGSIGFDQPAGMVRMSSREVVIAGTTEGLNYDAQLGRYSKSINGNRDGFLVRMDEKLQRVMCYTYFGGEGNDRITDVVAGSDGEIFITGETESYDLPVTSTASGRSYSGETDGFMAGFRSDLSGIIVCTYYGGSGVDRAVAITLDSYGGICIAGNTTSPKLPTTFPASTSGAGGGMLYGGKDIFLSCFSRSGYMTRGRFVGTSGDETITAMILDASDNIHIVGETSSTSFAAASKRRYSGGNSDAYLMKLDARLNIISGSGGLFGGSGDDRAIDIAMDNGGRIVITGVSSSRDFPDIGGIGSIMRGKQDVFLVEFSKDGKNLLQAGLIGGSESDSVVKVAIDQRTGAALLFGQTRSSDFPVTEGEKSDLPSATADGFIVRASGSEILTSFVIGGNGTDIVHDGWADAVGGVVFIASTSSSDLALQGSPMKGANEGFGIIVGRCIEGSISLMSPLGGETLCSGSMLRIQWITASLPDTTRFRVEIAPEGSSQWTTIASGVTGGSLQWRAASLTDGGYLVRVSTDQGHADQLLVPITVASEPVITTHPQNQVLCNGSSTDLYVSARGLGLAFQWRQNGRAIEGATSASYRVAGLRAGDSVRIDCEVTGACGQRIITNAATITGSLPPRIILQPKSVDVHSGSAFTLRVAAEGAGISYTWLRNGIELGYATSSAFTVTPASAIDAGWYSCRVSSPCGSITTDSVYVRLLTTSVNEVATPETSLRLIDASHNGTNTWLRLELGSSSDVCVRVIDVSGRSHSNLNTVRLDAGTHELWVATNDAPQGMYFAVVSTHAAVVSRPFMIIR